jgi:hypothetical protein
MSQLQVTGEAKIRDLQGPVVANSGVITALDGDASQYVRGDGTLADFPTSTGGGSSVSYYLNSSVSQGTIGGVAYRQLGKTPIAGAGTDITISANGYVASYITDANDPALLEVPAGNFNCEFYFSVNSNNHNPYVYAEVYKYDGTTFSLIGTSVGVPEYINQGTVINPYYFAIPVTSSALTITDRIAIRIYVNVDGRVVTLHTENGHLCQVVTTFSKGLTSLNNLTRQVQFLGTGTSGTDFNISSVTATHTFNLPIASATNTGKLSSSDWSVFNAKQAALLFTAPLNNTSNTISIPAATSLVDGYLDNLDWTKFNTAYNDSIISAAVTGTTTKTLTLNQQDGGTITASWTDDNTDAVTSVFGRTGAVVATSGDYNTSQVTENTNLYFTDARSRAALSFAAGSGAYNSTTGVITIPTNNNQITNGAGYITSSALSGYVPYTGATTNVNLGIYSLTANKLIAGSASTDNVAIFTTYDEGKAIQLKSSTGDLLFVPYFNPSTGARIIAQNTAGSAYTPLSFYASNFYFQSNVNFNSTIGNGTYTYTLPSATGTLALTSQIPSLSGYVQGTGTTNYLPKFTGASTIGNSLVYDNGNGVAFNGTNISYAATNRGNITINGTSGIIGFNNSGTAMGYFFHDGTNMQMWNELSGSLIFGNSATTRMTINASGNLGLGVTPSAWQTSSYRVIELPNGASIHGQTDAPLIEVASNMYINSSYNYTYTTNGYSTRYRQYQGVHSWLTAPSGTAGNAISFTQAMTLGANGNLLVGTTTDSGYKLDVNGTGRFRNELYVTGANNWELQSYSDGNLYINRAGVFSALSFNGSSGAATFSSSVSVKTNEAAEGISILGRSDDFAVLRFKQSNATLRYTIYTNPNDLVFDSPTIGTAFVVTQSGNVRIGNFADAGYKLDVNGTGRFTSSLRTSDIYVQNGTSGGYVSLRNGGAGAAGYMEIYSNNGTTRLGYIGYSISNLLYTVENGARHQFEGGAATFSSSVTASGSGQSYPSLSLNNAVGSSGTYQKYADFTAGSTLIARMLRGNGYSGYESNGLNIDNFAGMQIQVNALGGNGGAFTVLGGNVGIGTTSPSNILTVQANDTFNQDASGQLVLRGASNTAKCTRIGFDTTNNYGYVQSIEAGVSTRPFVLQPFGGNVGIGTSSPVSKLDVIGGNISISNNSGLFIRRADGTNGQALFLDDSNNLNIGYGTADVIRFATYLNTERMRITSSGNVGIGTSSPTAISGFTSLTINNATNGGIIDFQANGTGVGRIINDATTFNVLALGGSVPLILGANGSEKMRITSGGNVLIGTTSENSYGSARSIQINGSGGSLYETRFNGTSGVRVGSGSDHSYMHEPRNVEMRFATSDSTRFYIYGNGNYSFTGSNVSDRRAKDNIATLELTATDKIMQLEAKSYNMKNNPSQKRYGFIAQDVKEVVADLVSGNDKDGYLGLDYDGLLTIAIKAIQEQQKQIEILKQKIYEN